MSKANVSQEQQTHAVSENVSNMPEVNTLTFSDLKACLTKGIADFCHAPFFGIFFGGFYTFGGLLIIQSLYVWEKGWLIYPMLVGFPLIGPFVAVGLYDISRKLEAGRALHWNEILFVVRSQAGGQLAYMAFVMLFIFWIWIYQIRLLIAIILGRMSFTSWGSFFEIITTTPEGWIFIVVGHVIGAFFSIVLFSVTVVSLPLLLDRDVDFVTAMITSVKTVLASRFVMLCWGAFIGVVLMLSFLPAFLGLLVVLPVLGHATWHIYKRAVV